MSDNPEDHPGPWAKPPGQPGWRDVPAGRAAPEASAPEPPDQLRPVTRQLHRTDFAAAIARNKRRSWLMVLVLAGLAGMVGYGAGWALDLLFQAQAGPVPDIWIPRDGGLIGAGIMVTVALIWSAIMFWGGPALVLRSLGAEEASRESNRRLFNVVEEMSIASGLPMPKVYVIPTPALNAFATGMRPDKAVIGVTRGLLSSLSRDELQAVIGHEMGHVLNDDIRLSTLVAVLVGVIALVADWANPFRFGGRGRSYTGSSRRGGKGDGAAMLVAIAVLAVIALLAPVAALLVQMAVSREREYLADATSVKLTRNPDGMIAALEKLRDTHKSFPGANRAMQHMFIVHPARDFGARASALFSTHPPIDARIRRLRNLE